MNWIKGLAIAAGVVAITVLALWFAKALDSSKSKHPSEQTIPTLVVDLPPVKQDDFIVYCNEAEFQTAFERLRQFVHVATPGLTVPGGPMLIAVADVKLSQELQAPKRAMIELLKRHTPRRVVLVAHDGCLLYDTIAAWNNDPAGTREREFADLDRARSAIKTWFPNTTVEVWYGERVSATQMRFRPAPEEAMIRARQWFAADSISLPKP